MDMTHKAMRRRATERAIRVKAYKQEHPDATLDKMARIFRVSRETIRIDLLKGV